MSKSSRNLELINRLKETNISLYGVNLAMLSQIFLFEVYLKRLKSNNLLNIAKLLSLDSFLKFFSTFTKRSKLSLKEDVVFINDVYNKSMIDNIRKVQTQYGGNTHELIVDKRLKTKSSIYLWSYFSFRNYCADFIPLVNELITKKKQIRFISKLFRVHSLLFTLNLIESLFILNCVKGFLDHNKNLKKVVLNSDVHKVARAFVYLAKSKNIKTYVLQHGSTVLEYGYLPVMADRIFTWGNHSNNWFLSRGTKSEKFITTGTPKMDCISKYNIKANEKTKRILVVVNPIGDEQVLNYLNLLYNARIQDNYEVTLKLHPSSSDNKNEVNEVFGSKNIEIVKHKNIHQLINDSDFVITTTSTVGNEAIALKKPLIQVAVKNSLSTLDYEKFGCSVNVKSSSELKIALNNRALINSKLLLYDRFITGYFYKLDGLAAQRIVSAIKEGI